MKHKIILLIMTFFCSTVVLSDGYHYVIDRRQIMLVLKPLYDNIWGTIYNAEKKQCDNTPNVTGDGSKIDVKKASKYRWIAISQNMLSDINRANTLVYDRTDLFKGKIAYGDTIWIRSPYNQLNGWWVVHDTKNSRYTRSIDFLQTAGDATLYNNNPLWSGKFDSIRIYTADLGENQSWKNSKIKI